MERKMYIVKDKAGLHARPASILSASASKYRGNVDILYKDKKVTLKSIMALMSLGIPYQGEFFIEVTGDKEKEQITSFTDILTKYKII